MTIELASGGDSSFVVRRLPFGLDQLQSFLGALKHADRYAATPAEAIQGGP
ncbi:hypothetical protein [Caulobacter sp. 602-1]|uniref:hypothetical protein n=1 Tax=Caulobacter sp. 602-1 TaxID=2492472 RepID=UPI001315570A|nr:hypothetical protein [Caulobacter sp. 602-1]